MKIKDVLYSIVLISVIGAILFGIFYFFIRWESLKAYLKIVFMFADRHWWDVILAMVGWGLSLVCLSFLSESMDSERLLALISAFPVRFLTIFTIIYIIWGSEGIGVLYSFGERIPMAIVIWGVVVAFNVVSGVIKLIFQELF